MHGHGSNVHALACAQHEHAWTRLEDAFSMVLLPFDVDRQPSCGIGPFALLEYVLTFGGCGQWVWGDYCFNGTMSIGFTLLELRGTPKFGLTTRSSNLKIL